MKNMMSFKKNLFVKVLVGLCLPAMSLTALANTVTYGFADLEALMLKNSPSLRAAASEVDAARFAVTTARAFPNPQIESLKGTRASRLGAVDPNRQVKSISVSQELDMPWHRFPRVDAAEAGFTAADANQRAFLNDMRAKLRVRYYDLLRRQSESIASREDRTLMEGIRSRIALMVETGESARFELVKADAEMLNAQKLAQSAELRVHQSRVALRALVGPELPENFEVIDLDHSLPTLPPLKQVQAEMLATNPEIARTRAERLQLEKKLNEEKALRLPKLTLRAEQDQDPDYTNKRVGVALEVPLWNWRSGPVGEAAARLTQTSDQLVFQEFSLLQALDAAYQQLSIAQAQVVALESGIVRQTANALRISEIAYKAGEKGFLEVLDAQRAYRAARNELITARFELSSAWTEIERIRATPPIKP
jgi:cobalt-zinc-cadmium efflux system outer membrane protein